MVLQNLSGTTTNEALYVILWSTGTSISFPRAGVYCTLRDGRCPLV